MRQVFFSVLIATVSSHAYAQSSLPPCEGRETFTYSSCFGSEGREGKRYLGEWLHGFYHGQGTLNMGQGERYVGQFRKGQFSGNGTHTIANTYTYVGEFQDDRRNGFGALTFADGRKYVGPFQGNSFKGQGVFTWPDGKEFIGDFFSGGNNYRYDFDGTGILKWPNGAKYEGEVRDGRPHGKGTLTFPDGSTKTGRFEFGNLNAP